MRKVTRFSPGYILWLTRPTILISVTILSGWLFTFSSASSPDHEQYDTVVIEAVYPGYSEFSEAASEIDIWTVDHATASFRAMVTQDQVTWLVSKGFKVTIDEQATYQSATEVARSCYRPISALYERLAQINQAHPELTEMIQYGTSYEGRPLWVLRITNEKNASLKPRFFVISGAHGREMITPEMAMVFIEFLLDNYANNPDTRMVVDWQETYVIVSANPDGHIRNEPEFAWWRKNTHPYTTCSSGTYGVDLNRNHDFHWGYAGASTNPCSEVYRGPTPASEPETVALQGLVRSLFPDQRGSELSDPAPKNTTGILITVHSFADLILWPWGDSFDPPPNSAELTLLGQQMARFNGYTPTQSINLYPTSGTADDWAYGELGIAAYTLEIGGANDGFNPYCSRYNDLTQPNLGALFYAAQSSLSPYTMPSGPEIETIQLDRFILKPGETVSVVVNAIEKPLNGENTISAIQLFIDAPPWAGGPDVMLDPLDSAFDSSQESGAALLAIANLASGQHHLHIRAMDDQGNWGLFKTTALWVGEATYAPLVSK